MGDSLPLKGLRFSISGSAGTTATGPVDRALLQRCHAFVRALTLEILRAGGDLVTLVDGEPRLDQERPETAQVFSWTQLEAVAAYVPERAATHPDRPLLHAHVSLDPLNTRIPPHRHPLWAQLLDLGDVVHFENIPSERIFGGYQRRLQARDAHVLITLGGGIGTFDLHELFRQNARPVLPLDADIGSSCNDGQASLTLHRQALNKPESFVPAEQARWFLNKLPRLSFASDTPPEDLARRVFDVLVGLAPSLRGSLDVPAASPLPAGPAVRRSLPDCLHFLVLADEWWSHSGGISTFNRDLCKALARANHTVSLFIPRSSLDPLEVEEIRCSSRLSLVNSGQKTVQELEELLLQPELDKPPDVIIGHGAITGKQASVQREKYFPNSLLVHFVHVSPIDTEYKKDKPAAVAMIESDTKDRAQADLAGASDLVVAVGPLLANRIWQSLASRSVKVQVHTLLPWIQEYGSQQPPQQKACLCIGRADSFHLKGLDLACAAISKLDEKPLLFMRGVAPADAEDLTKRVLCWSKGNIDFRPQQYTVSQADINASFHRATVVLMPSRTEGFGLVGIEAIARGVPFLTSDESGLAEILREHGGEPGSLSVVSFGPRDEENIDRLHAKLSPIWTAPDAAFKSARQLLSLLRPHLNEDKSISAFVDALRSLSH